MTSKLSRSHLSVSNSSISLINASPPRLDDCLGVCSCFLSSCCEGSHVPEVDLGGGAD